MIYDAIKKLRDDGDINGALILAIDSLNTRPDDSYLLYLIGSYFRQLDRLGEARAYLKQAVKTKPDRAEPLIELAQTYKWANEFHSAIDCFEAASKIDPGNVNLWVAWAMLYAYGRSDADYGQMYAEHALDLQAGYAPALDVLSVCAILREDWNIAWVNADRLVGYCPNRKRRTYAGSKAKPWAGEPGRVVAIYGEQGLGDEIMFSSCLEEAAMISREIYVECNPRLANLFARSFGSVVNVYGTLLEERPGWYTEEAARLISDTCAFGVLPKYFRTTVNSFRATARGYLVADKAKVEGYQRRWAKDDALYHIGIAWTGGMISRPWEREERNIPLPLFFPPIDHPRRRFVSLEYNDTGGSVEGYPIDEIDGIKGVGDYDDTASLVASLDLVIAVPTTVVHLAGALGIPCICIVPEIPSWRFGLTGNRMVWHDSVSLIRRAPGEAHDDLMIRVAEAVDAHFRNVSFGH